MDGDRALQLALRSQRLLAAAGGADALRRMHANIDDDWLEVGGRRIHVDRHRCENPRATIVFQPGSGSYGRFYFVLGGLLARHGYRMLAIDRPGHGASDGPRGDCTVPEALDVAAAVVAQARSASNRPVVLMGSSLGGLLTVFGMLAGIDADAAVAHNFVYPGKLASMRLRARWIARHRRAPYPLAELVHGFDRLSADSAISEYLRAADDPLAAWQLTPRSVASLFGYRAAPAARRPARAPWTLLVSGTRDAAIPAWATRLFGWWAAPRPYDVQLLAGAGHLLFHDELPRSVPPIVQWLDRRLPAAALGGSA
ncbi:MAG TPA: alpha/beta fold hydrolase [Burkholderiaceae bacterium]|nr:alpha/beta fold hydrolase [Burkholderiaceae bacterium]